jgi:hypothetical protein
VVLVGRIGEEMQPSTLTRDVGSRWIWVEAQQLI